MLEKIKLNLIISLSGAEKYHKDFVLCLKLIEERRFEELLEIIGSIMHKECKVSKLDRFKGFYDLAAIKGEIVKYIEQLDYEPEEI